MRGALGLTIEIAALGAGWLVYQTGSGTGPQGAVAMMWGAVIAGAGLLAGGLVGLVSLIKGAKDPALPTIALLIPLGILGVVFLQRLGPL